MYRAGMDDYITKPVKPEDLAQVLEKLLAEAEVNSKAETSSTQTTPPPVDLERLFLAMGDEPEELSEILGVYLSQMEDSLEKMEAAIKTGNAVEVDLIAHNCAGVSANCGMVRIVSPLRELERMGRENQLDAAAAVSAQARREFQNVKTFLQENLEQVMV